jgi:hypothetical protein
MTQHAPSRDEKLRILEDERWANSRSAYTGVTDPVAGGRFARALPEHINGREPFVDVPRLPAGGPWGDGPQVGLEPPFDGDINFVEACGTFEEQERAAAIAAANVAAAPPATETAPASPRERHADPSGFTEGSATATPLPVATLPPASDEVASPTLSDPSRTGDQQLAGSALSSPVTTRLFYSEGADPLAASSGSAPSTHFPPADALPVEGTTRREELAGSGSPSFKMKRRFG